MQAAGGGYVDMTRLLLARGAAINALSGPPWGG
jgi:hypothetical protein